MLLMGLKQQRNAIYYGCDIDSRCVGMATINLFLNGATGYTFRMNSLSMEIRGGYHFHTKFGLPCLIELSAEQCKQILTPPQLEQKEFMERYVSEEGEQLSLF